jgi:hypothetical protein
MPRKAVPIISVIVLSVLAGWFLFESNSVDKELMEETFVFDAIYYEEDQIIEITFQDNSQKTSKVVLEILGLEESFQKTFTNSQFAERVPFNTPPKYGWKTHPVTLVVEHEDFDMVGLKTEIHAKGEPAEPIIYSSL